MARSFKPNGSNKSNLPLMKANALGAWHVDAGELEAKVLGMDVKKIELKNVDECNTLVAEKKELGERLMTQYARDYVTSKGRNGGIKMVMTTQRSGTIVDKVSAFSVLVADDPIANLKSLDALLGMVTSKIGKRHALMGFETLRELFITSLLPDRKLKNLFQRPINHIPESKDGYSLLLFWYWEELLKQRYERFVSATEEASKDMLPVLKDKALKTIYVLLKCKSEQEHRLLAALVNKLGDPESKAASNADFHLLELLQYHPNMKAVVIDEVDSFLFRPHLGLRSKYHAVNFLSQIPLTRKGDGPVLAKRLMGLYFAVFKVLTFDMSNGGKSTKNRKVTQNKRSIEQIEPQIGADSRILSALLTGVNRAFPYVANDGIDDIIAVQTPILFKLVHSDNFNVGIEALMLLHKISSRNQVVSDRFYRALYSKLLLPAAMNTSKVENFFSLLLRAMKNDINLRRVAAFSKRLLQVALHVIPPYACGCLFLLSEILKARPPLWKMVRQNESNDDDDDVEHFVDIADETDGGKIDDVDLAGDKDNHRNPDGMQEPVAGNNLKNNPGHKKVSNNGEREGRSPDSAMRCSTARGYNPWSREPSYCNADHVSWWELTVLASHVHPSVSAMAKTLLAGANIVYNGNPLNDLSLTAFLDKFMEKKPKESTWHGGSKIGPAKKVSMSNHLIGAEILSLAEVEVPPEDMMFHKFYTNKMSSSSKRSKKRKKNAIGEDADDLIIVGDNDGGSDIDDDDVDDIDDMDGGISLNADGDYDYDDLDKVGLHDDDDDDLVGDLNDDGNVGSPSDSEEDFKGNSGPKKKQRSVNAGASPFSNLEEFEHMIDADEPQKKSKCKKRKRTRRT